MPVTGAEASPGPAWTLLGGDGTARTVLRFLGQRARLQAQAHAQQQQQQQEPCMFEAESSDDDGLDTQHGAGTSMDTDEVVSMQQAQLSQPVPTCSYLTAGQVFRGYQRFSTPPGRTGMTAADDWQVSLRVQACDMAKGYACGVMEASNVPCTRGPICTFWEAEIIDNVHHTFYTHKWGASRETDIAHWSRFSGWSSRIRSTIVHNGGRTHVLPTHTHVFLRMKEQFYVNAGADCGLTIAGFYYCCLDRQTGALSGVYYDPCSTPFQHLELKPQQPTGMAFGSYCLA